MKCCEYEPWLLYTFVTAVVVEKFYRTCPSYQFFLFKWLMVSFTSDKEIRVFLSTVFLFTKDKKIK